MSTRIQPMIELSRRANNVLVQELGIVDAMRFLSQFRVGSGDYTAEREQLFQGASVKVIVAEIKANRKKADGVDADKGQALTCAVQPKKREHA